MDEWLSRSADAIAREAGVPRETLELTPAEERALLDLARIAAHTSGSRTNAPLLSYLVGRSGADVEALARAVREAH
jgi:hypothetical protein